MNDWDNIGVVVGTVAAGPGAVVVAAAGDVVDGVALLDLDTATGGAGVGDHLDKYLPRFDFVGEFHFDHYCFLHAFSVKQFHLIFLTVVVVFLTVEGYRHHFLNHCLPLFQTCYLKLIYNISLINQNYNISLFN